MAAEGEEFQKLVAPADFDGPTKHKHCTDIFCLGLLFAAWIFMTGIGIYALTEGDYRLILYPLDYDGNICGTDYAADMRGYPFLYYVNAYTAGVCVNKCPNLQGMTADNLTDVRTFLTYNGTWQARGKQLPPDFIEVADYSQSPNAVSCTARRCFPDPYHANASWTTTGVRKGQGFAFYAGSTYWALWRCFLTADATKAIEEQVDATQVLSTSSLSSLNGLDETYKFWNRLYSDIYTARYYILGFGFGVSLGVSLIYVFLMRLPMVLTSIVWGSIGASIAMFFVGGIYAWNRALAWSNENPQTVEDKTIKATASAAIILFAMGALVALIACCLRKSIQLAVICVKEAGKAVNNMVLLMLLPVLQFIGLLIFVSVFCVYAIHLASLGDIIVQEIPLDDISDFVGDATNTDDLYLVPIKYRIYNFNEYIRACAWYYLFCFFWTSNFIVAVGDMMIALSVAKWYFTREKWKVGSWTVLKSIQEVITYHLGTCAFGSCLVAIVKTVRAMLAKVEKYAKEHHNFIAQYLISCCQCCMYCLEKFIKFVNKNAYIQTAIFSTPFCASCRASFALIFRNASRVGAVSYVSAAVLVIGKMFISAVTTAGAYIAITQNLNDQLFSVGGPVVVIFLLSYWISDFFMHIFDMGISTVLHCFIADEEMFSGDQCFAEPELKAYIDNYGGSKT